MTAGFQFDVPVRFDTDYLEVDLSAFAAGAIPKIPLVEIECSLPPPGEGNGTLMRNSFRPAAKLDSGATTLCRCWLITRSDGVVQGFTDHDETRRRAVTCRAGPGLTAARRRKRSAWR